MKKQVVHFSNIDDLFFLTSNEIQSIKHQWLAKKVLILANKNFTISTFRKKLLILLNKKYV